MSGPAATVLVRPVTTAADRAAAFAIRTEVFQDEQGVPADEEFDADDDVATHVLAEIAGAPVGTGRLVWAGAVARIGRMAVRRRYRRRGVGRALLATLMAEARTRPIERIVLHAQVQALGFYAASGFVAHGPEFFEAGIPHRRMELRLDAPTTPPGRTPRGA